MIILNILHNQSHKYFNYYIKFVGFKLIYFTINLGIDTSSKYDFE